LILIQILVGYSKNATGDVDHIGVGTMDVSEDVLNGELTIHTEACSRVLDDWSERRGTVVAGRSSVHVGHLEAKVVIAVTGLAITKRRDLAEVLRSQGFSYERAASHSEDG
jgi:hypothetical protein